MRPLSTVRLSFAYLDLYDDYQWSFRVFVSPDEVLAMLTSECRGDEAWMLK